MRLKSFWTGYQQPLSQAVLIEDGQVKVAIPPRPAKTPTRQVWCVGEWDDKLLVGKRASLEMWSNDGLKLLATIYHPWMYTMHYVGKYDDRLLICSPALDAVMLMDLDGNISWEWWAWMDGYMAKVDEINKPNWQVTQTTQQWCPDKWALVNSVNAEPDGSLLLTMLHAKKVVRVTAAVTKPKSVVVMDTSVGQYTGIHDFQYDRRTGAAVPIFGAENGLWVGNNLLFQDRYHWIKRVRPAGDKNYLFSHMRGVVLCDGAGNVLQEFSLPQPFGTVLPKFE